MRATQLPLRLTLRDDALFDNFITGQNAQCVDILNAFLLNKTEPFIYCYGSAGSGKTHLLQSCCHVKPDLFYFSLTHYAEFSPRIFESLENQSWVCVDDIDAVIGKAEWEEALFHFYNRARQQKTQLLVSAKKPPQQLQCVLRDLQSRLCSALSLEIKNLSDDEKIQALKMRSQSRGLILSDDVSHYLLHRYSRNMHDLFCLLDTLDQASLIEKRKLTIPFVKSIMEPQTIS